MAPATIAPVPSDQTGSKVTGPSDLAERHPDGFWTAGAPAWRPDDHDQEMAAGAGTSTWTGQPGVEDGAEWHPPLVLDGAPMVLGDDGVIGHQGGTVGPSPDGKGLWPGQRDRPIDDLFGLDLGAKGDAPDLDLDLRDLEGGAPVFTPGGALDSAWRAPDLPALTRCDEVC